MDIRIGLGVDVHKFDDERDLWLGGIKIPYHKGLLGHSDADVIIHAICDALLGAANMRDIGHHFPDNSSQYKNIDSKILLKDVHSLINAKGWKIGNVDVTVCLEKPKLASFIQEMQKTLSSVLMVDDDRVSIKATTTEKLGFVGKGEGVKAYAVALIQK